MLQALGASCLGELVAVEPRNHVCSIDRLANGLRRTATPYSIISGARMPSADRSALPLVSVGIPTYNRSKGLEQTLRMMRGQTWANLEIIVSDNASPDPAVEAVARAAAAEDSRVRYVRQLENRGPIENFEFVLRESKGDFFLWASDDDQWIPTFIERCVLAHLGAHSPLAMVAMEARHMTSDGPCPPFFEGNLLRGPVGGSATDRLRQLIHSWYSNMIYGVYRRDALFLDGRATVAMLGKTLVQLPLYMVAAVHGDMMTLPEFGLFKLGHKKTYEHARWEQEGGPWPRWWRPRNAFKLIRHTYHMLKSSLAMLDAIDIGSGDRHQLKRLLIAVELRHTLNLCISWKPKRKGFALVPGPTPPSGQGFDLHRSARKVPR